jgi:hypothetical protein
MIDNEKAVTTEHVAGIPVRDAATAGLSRHYGLTMRPACRMTSLNRCPRWVEIGGEDCEGGPGAHGREPACRVRLVRRDGGCVFVLLRPGERRPAPCDPAGARGMLADGRARLRPVPAGPFTTALGVTAKGRAVAGHVRGQPALSAASAGRTGRMGAAAQRAGRHHSFGPAAPTEVACCQAAMQGSPWVGDARYSPGPAQRAEPDAQGQERGRGRLPGDR